MIPDILETRQRLEAKIEELIEMLDLLDGDIDVEEASDDDDDKSDWEPSGDESDHSAGEDEWH